MGPTQASHRVDAWLRAAERRYTADLRVQEITRALRALSSAYVERRERGGRQHVHGALDTAGKRAAFALYYAPLHFMAVSEVVHSLRARMPAPESILDLGCGTGAAGAAWALAARHSGRSDPGADGAAAASSRSGCRKDRAMDRALAWLGSGRRVIFSSR